MKKLFKTTKKHFKKTRTYFSSRKILFNKKQSHYSANDVLPHALSFNATLAVAIKCIMLKLSIGKIRIRPGKGDNPRSGIALLELIVVLINLYIAICSCLK